MTDKILILGGVGRIGSQVARDLATRVNAAIVVTVRRHNYLKQDAEFNSLQFLPLDLADLTGLRRAVADSNLVIHCAGPFHHRDGRALKICIEEGINYIDVSDCYPFYHRLRSYHDSAMAAGVTAIVNTGVFPGISNSMVRQGMECLDEAETIQISYAVAGSGGAGLTVMRTTFLGLREAFQAWIDGQWQRVLPYSDRELVSFPPPLGSTGVYWYEMPETHTLKESFPVQTVITKFGSVPDFYNYLTWGCARFMPSSWLASNRAMEFLARVSYQMTAVTDKFTGVGVAMQVVIIGSRHGKKVKFCSSMVRDNTAVAAGCGTGSVAQLLLEHKINQPGIWPVERVVPTPARYGE